MEKGRTRYYSSLVTCVGTPRARSARQAFASTASTNLRIHFARGRGYPRYAKHFNHRIRVTADISGQEWRFHFAGRNLSPSSLGQNGQIAVVGFKELWPFGYPVMGLSERAKGVYRVSPPQESATHTFCASNKKPPIRIMERGRNISK